MAASGALLDLLPREFIERCDRFAADLGPGSFTGVRVGVALAKVLAFRCGGSVAGAPSFDLITLDGVAVVPSKKNENLARAVGREPEVIGNQWPESGIGYGAQAPEVTYPRAERFLALLDRLEWMDPARLLPFYYHPPSISQPKRPVVGGRPV